MNNNQVPDPAPHSAQAQDDTRERLIRAGLTLFGASGIDGVSTRKLAEVARVNQAAIPYHFGGKEGVYRAVAAHLVQSTGVKLRSLAAQAQAAGDPEARLKTFLRGATLVILGEPDAPFRGGFIMREQLQPTSAFDLLYEGFMRPVHESLSLLVAEIQGGDSAAAPAIFKAQALLGQVLSFGVARQLLLRRLGKETLSEADAAQISETVASLAARSLRP